MTIESRNAIPTDEHDIPDVRTLARQHTQAVMTRLEQWLASQDDRASMAAAAMLLDRGWGTVEGRSDAVGTPVTVIRVPNVADDTQAWRGQYGP